MKKLLVILTLTALVTAPEAALARRGGNCGSSCAPCATKCPKDCPPVRSCPGKRICIEPPCADVRQPCEKTECFVEEAPVRCFRKLKTCTVQQAGPVEFECPITDEIVAVGGEGAVTVAGEAAPAMEKQPAKAARGTGRRAARRTARRK